jgi:hypothetical protein
MLSSRSRKTKEGIRCSNSANLRNLTLCSCRRPGQRAKFPVGFVVGAAEQNVSGTLAATTGYQMYTWWKSLSFRTKVIVCSVFAWSGLSLFSLTLQWIAGSFLYTLAWKYSAIITVPLGICWSIYTYNSLELRQKLGRQFWFAVLTFPLITYYMLGLSIMKIPGALVYLLPFQRSVEIVSVDRLGSNPQQCLGKSTLDTNEYPSFLQTGVCVGGEIASLLKPGDKLAIEGKRGLGGILVERYARVAANKP